MVYGNTVASYPSGFSQLHLGHSLLANTRQFHATSHSGVGRKFVCPYAPKHKDNHRPLLVVHVAYVLNIDCHGVGTLALGPNGGIPHAHIGVGGRTGIAGGTEAGTAKIGTHAKSGKNGFVHHHGGLHPII